ncbi:sensor domain-containing protein [Halorussus sp. MSC15.2]|uniref:sensor domain-containing protein n=1 Tax=Halorussus sp. MSC15.2 TaxID=2283638 RepID=UPI0013D0275C|nr:sensor domain-containing protein [Halorussus sp. MSC15.2]NEU55982.1 hypothetical protein [Halorussus sp. MSC15.2]
MTTDHRATSLTGALGTVFGVPFRLQTYRNLLYLVLAFPLGLAYFTFLSVGLPIGVGLAITVVGTPILLAVLAVSTGLAGVERKIATLLLGIEVESPGWVVTDSGSITERCKRLVTDLGTWKAIVYLGSKLVIGVAAFVSVMVLLVTAVSMLAVPLVYDQPGVYVGIVTDAPIQFHPSLYVVWRNLLVGVETVVSIDAWQVTTLPAALGVAGLGVLLGVASLHLLNGLARLSAWYTKLMLGTNAETPSPW